jgi:hypothetical protein
VRTSGFVEPCLPTPAERPPADSGWVHETSTTATG